MRNDNAAGRLPVAPYLLLNQVQPYAWGEQGKGAFIPRLLGIEPEEGQPYAELWLGAHPNAPSRVVVDGATLPLPELIARHPQEILGAQVARRFHNSLPFLFKVLSAAEPVSIQAHPNKAQAVRLHAADPQHYPDDNHKPEIAIALDELDALIGFKPLAGIVQTLRDYPELAELLGPEVSGGLMAAGVPSAAEACARLRRLYATLTRRSLEHKEDLAEAGERLTARLAGLAAPNDEQQLFLGLRRRYPGPDLGLFSALLLNRLRLRPGEGIFIPAGVPHAYLRGNIIECMAASDNVVRAGLTAKFVDAPAIEEVLTCEPGPPPISEPSAGAREVIYRTPAAEFQVSRMRLCAGEEWPQRRPGPQVLLLCEGQALIRWAGGTLALGRGQSALVPAALDEYGIAAQSALELYRAEVPPVA